MNPESRVKLLNELERTRNQLKSDDLSTKGYYASIFGLMLFFVFLSYTVHLLVSSADYVVYLWILSFAIAAVIIKLILLIIRYHVNRKILTVYEIIKLSSDTIDSQ